MTTVGYNQCNNVTNNFYTVNQHSNVDLRNVKNEPVDSTTNYNQQSNSPNQQSYYIQQQVQNINLCSHLPPTPPSPTGHSLSNSSSDVHFDNNQININNQINTSINKINQFNSQINNQSNIQLKDETSYLSIKDHQNLIQPNQHQTTNKYRKKNNQLHNTKPYSIPSKNQLTRQQKGNNSLSKRNERERKRVEKVSLGFDKLRNHIPKNDTKKLSKVQTLRLAVKYIQHLEKILNKPDGSTDTTEIFSNLFDQNDQSNDQYSNQDNSSLDYFDLTELFS